MPPVAKKNPLTRTIHGDTLTDEYAWLRDRDDPDTIAHLEAENAYADEVMAPFAQLQQTLYEEMLGRIKETDASVPFRKGAHFYNTRTVAGKQYPIWMQDERVILDMNELAVGKEYMDLGGLEPSDDGRLLLFSTDDTGYRQFTLQVKDLHTGEMLPDRAENTDSLTWAADDRTVFYTIENEAKRQYRLYRHVLGTGEHTLVYEEEDEEYDLGATRSRSGEWIFVYSESKTTNEVRLIPAIRPDAKPVVVMPRRDEHRYYLDHRGDRFYILTNDEAKNFRIMTAPVDDIANWTELVPHRPLVKIEQHELFRDHMVLRLLENGLPELEIHDFRSGQSHRIAFPEAAYNAMASANEVFDTKQFRYTYESLVTPPSVFDYDMDARTSVLLKRTECLGGYDPSRYVVERIFVTARDGARVPVALVRRRDVEGPAPLLLWGYGSYGAVIPDAFNSNRYSLIDRGVTFAIAHIRGGGEMGEEWHDGGKLMEKKNTFNDFIDAAEELIARRYTSAELLAIEGGSAGGLLVGAVVNMRPELFRAALALVPFVDVINTMLDPTLPLTTLEYVEWGDPSEREAYAYIKSYDPYSNVARQEYPAMLVRTSINDSQVGYWEAAKWVARLRERKTDRNPLVLRVNLGAGHGGASGRYDKLREHAHDYAWLLGVPFARALAKCPTPSP